MVGPYVAFSAASVSSQISEVKLFVMDLRTHRRRALAVASFGEAPLEDELLGGFVVTRRGAVAWVRTMSSETGPDSSRLEADRGAGAEVLDPGPNVENGSLAVTASGRRLYWTSAGEPHAASLR